MAAYTWETVPEDIKIKSYYLVAVEERDGILRPTMSYLDHSGNEGDGWAVVSLSENRDEAVVVVYGGKVLHKSAESHGERILTAFPDAKDPDIREMAEVLALVDKDKGSLSTFIDQSLETYKNVVEAESEMEKVK